MSIAGIFGFALLSFVLGAQVFLRERYLTSVIRYAWIVAIAFVFGWGMAMMFFQYALWDAGAFSRYLLPPYQTPFYFLLYAGRRFLFPAVVALIAAMLTMHITRRANARASARFFDTEEPSIFGLAVFVSGYPGLLVYIALLLLLIPLVSLMYRMLSSLKRMPLTFLWLPIALFAIIVTEWLFSLGELNIFLF